MAVPLTIIKPAGVFDGVQANELRHQLTELLASGHNLVMLDMTDVNFIDSSGLGALIIALKMLRTDGGDLYLCSIAEPVRSLLSMTRMDRLFENSISLEKEASSLSEKPKIAIVGCVSDSASVPNNRQWYARADANTPYSESI